jgi:hypothetical protein
MTESLLKSAFDDQRVRGTLFIAATTMAIFIASAVGEWLGSYPVTAGVALLLSVVLDRMLAEVKQPGDSDFILGRRDT